MMLLLRADADPGIGTGHVMRCLTIAEAWIERGHPAALICRQIPSLIADRARSIGVELHLIAAERGDADDAKETAQIARARGAKVVIVDGYSFGASWHTAIAGAGLRTLLINDRRSLGFFPGDAILNQNPSATHAQYEDVAERCRLLLGPQFALLRKDFRNRSRRKKTISNTIRHILVTMGGSDPSNTTAKVLEALTGKPFEVRVIAGGSNEHVDLLERIVTTSLPRGRLIVNAIDMAKHMAWADLAIAAAGSTALELAFMGVPTLYIVTADNQRDVAEGMERANAGLNLGSSVELTEQRVIEGMRRISEPQLREELMQNAQRLVDGKGVERVLAEVIKLTLAIRPPEADDRRIVWEWANDPHVRQMSFTSAAISWSDHQSWWTKHCAANVDGCYIGLDGQMRRIGIVRFERTSSVAATVSINLAPEARGKGYGQALLELACERFVSACGKGVIDAYIKPANLASIRCFERAGFSRRGAATIHGIQALHYTR